MSKKGRDYILYLEDILTAIDKIERYTHGLTFEQFCKNDILIDAIIRNFEVIGEAAKNIPDNVKQKYNHVEWREAVGLETY